MCECFVQVRQIGKSADHGSWISPESAAPGLYEIRATADPDTPEFGTMNTWLALTSNRSWSEHRSGVGIDSATFKVEIRYNGGDIIAEASCTLTAEVDI